MSEMTLLDRQPEEWLVEESKVRGLVVRCHRLAWFRIEMVAVVADGKAVTVVRREADVGPRGVLTLAAEERFACRPYFLAKLDRQLARLGVARAQSFAAEGVLDGVSLACRYRDRQGGLHQVHLFCWDESEDPVLRQLGGFLQQLAQSSRAVLRRRAWLSWLW